MSCGGNKTTPPAKGDGGTPSKTPVKTCPKACTITSETFRSSPANRARTKIGVGEEVTLTVTPGPATWTVAGAAGTLTPNSGSHSSVTLTAQDVAGSVTITANAAGCSCAITFTVVEPANWTMKRVSGIKHANGRPDCGWQGNFYIHPNDVNFYNVNIREKDSQAVTTGSYNVFSGVWHGNYPPPDQASAWLSLTSHTDADGTKAAGTDSVYSGDPAAAAGAAVPFNVGTMHFPITLQWKVGTGAAKNFPIVRQEHEIYANGACESRKGGNTERKLFSEPTSSY